MKVIEGEKSALISLNKQLIEQLLSLDERADLMTHIKIDTTINELDMLYKRVMQTFLREDLSAYLKSIETNVQSSFDITGLNYYISILKTALKVTAKK